MKQRLAATVQVAFKLECRDKAGNLLKTVDVKAAVPLEKLAALVKEPKK
jgi:hypothetical protein